MKKNNYFKSFVKACLVSWALCIMWMSLEYFLYGKVQHRVVDDIIGIIIYLLVWLMFLYRERNKEYMKLERRLNALYIKGSEGHLAMFIELFLSKANNGTDLDGFRILTDEDAVLYDEWKKTR